MWTHRQTIEGLLSRTSRGISGFRNSADIPVTEAYLWAEKHKKLLSRIPDHSEAVSGNELWGRGDAQKK